MKSIFALAAALTLFTAQVGAASSIISKVFGAIGR